jgi:hypothetical protein
LGMCDIHAPTWREVLKYYDSFLLCRILYDSFMFYRFPFMQDSFLIIVLMYMVGWIDYRNNTISFLVIVRVYCFRLWHLS